MAVKRKGKEGIKWPEIIYLAWFAIMAISVTVRMNMEVQKAIYD